MSIDVEMLLALGTVLTGIALLVGVWRTLGLPARGQQDTISAGHTSTPVNPVALALHRDTLEKLMGLSQPRAGLVHEAAEGCIQNRSRRLEWAQFDRDFLSACLKRVGGSWICAPESFRRFSIKDHRLLLLSEQVYWETLGRTKQATDPDGRILRDLTQAYTDARKLHQE
jgi:hypothetical protein